MIILNYDNREVVLTVTPDVGVGGVDIRLSEKFATDEIAHIAAVTLAKRLGLRQRGTAWVATNKTMKKRGKR